MQRDHYLPLKVIGEHLDAIDRALKPPPIDSVVPTVPKVALASDGMPSAESFAGNSDLRLSRKELLKTAGIADELLGQLETYGLVKATRSGHYGADDLVIATAALELPATASSPRHLRAWNLLQPFMGFARPQRNREVIKYAVLFVPLATNPSFFASFAVNFNRPAARA